MRPAANSATSKATRRPIILSFNGVCRDQVSMSLRRRNNDYVALAQDEERRSIRVYASNERTVLEDVKSVIAEVCGDSPEREPARVLGLVDVDPFEAHVGAVKDVELYEPYPDEPAPKIPIPPKVRDLDCVAVDPEQVAIVRIVPARDRPAVRALAVAGLTLAIGFLLFLLAL
jgi:hypothetical protein